VTDQLRIVFFCRVQPKEDAGLGDSDPHEVVLCRVVKLTPGRVANCRSTPDRVGVRDQLRDFGAQPVDPRLTELRSLLVLAEHRPEKAHASSDGGCEDCADGLG
jgi:hypothetical protein